ncbi:MAG: hypothetical protein Q8927_16980 [Bacteroidota bacterium]|nr:hypothetical protein [Bacteroidota bacterium]
MTEWINRLAIGCTLSLCLPFCSRAQPKKEELRSDLVLYQERVSLARDLQKRVIGSTFTMPPDSNTEYKYESACHAISQFLFRSPSVDQGFGYLFAGYDSLSHYTKEAFLEAVYAVGRKDFAGPVGEIVEKETDPGLFTLAAVYLYRANPSTDHANELKIRMVEKFPGYDTIPVLDELGRYLSYHERNVQGKTPDIAELFAWRTGLKTLYSFQRWDRDYPGLAVMQNADGSMVRDADGRVAVFRQLARSGPDLPYFITDGSTPQGIYSIQGWALSHTPYIGPTPNIQLILPFEDAWTRFFHLERSENGQEHGESGGTSDSLRRYQSLLPPDWREYAPMMEAWAAGHIGRSEIIAHGSTIDPAYFSGLPFYPLTPTMGCLCAEELWNPMSGHLISSEQFNLVSAFLSTPGVKGYLYVINVDDQRSAVSREEVEGWVQRFERVKK